jgi:hypothetical protein
VASLQEKLQRLRITEDAVPQFITTGRRHSYMKIGWGEKRLLACFHEYHRSSRATHLQVILEEYVSHPTSLNFALRFLAHKRIGTDQC